MTHSSPRYCTQTTNGKRRPRKYYHDDVILLSNILLFLSPAPAGVSQAALNLFMGDLYMQKLQQSITENSNPIEMEEVANNVVHPITKETITNYKTYLRAPPSRQLDEGHV